jgi:DNA-binding CsgD family transcriptional regulator
MPRSRYPTHFHVKSIYAEFGVRNRATLAALWLGKLR